ncbi:hypothetical protein P7228_09730 [Altererythrobacter arenosus]|uniref:DUF2550 family protein n=1 Tax=Altererythrobacter arenosus TaxID=3032592 RepID=A0ABY8FN43_9SPHN|nr:hypothetical protein [Altererythrobacter sp. CAU 1644]WFL76277.1 hypothetical protein P7228_09730 [Altererythrobacter sp. CAU 1644]
MSLFTIIGFIIFGVVVVMLLKNKLADSPSMIVTGPGVLKTHDVECRFRNGATRYGKLAQDRWSDGQERFSLVLRDLPPGDEPVRLFRGEALISEFERNGSTLEFRWKGMSSEAIPQFEIGEQLRVEVGSLELTGTVEAD